MDNETKATIQELYDILIKQERETAIKASRNEDGLGKYYDGENAGYFCSRMMLQQRFTWLIKKQNPNPFHDKTIL